MLFDDWGFDYNLGMDCSNTGGNNSSSMEWIGVLFFDSNGNGTEIIGNPYPNFNNTDDVGVWISTNGLNTSYPIEVAFTLTHLYPNSGTSYTGSVFDTYGYVPGDGPRIFNSTNTSMSITTLALLEFYTGCWNLDVELFDNNAILLATNYGTMFTIGDTNSCDSTNGNNTGGNNTDSTVSIVWIDTNASFGGGDAEISVEHSGNWTAYWGITNINSAPTFPLWDYSIGWWNTSASGGLGTTTGSGNFTWLFQNMDQWGALAPPSCNVLMVALFDGNQGTASAQSTPAIDYPVGIDYQTFELGNITASDCNWESSWNGQNNTGDNNTNNNSDFADNDSDGISDVTDNCPNVFNSDQADLDNDGSGDLCDSDIDGDGAGNNDDTFPENPNEQVDTDGDGVGNNQDADDDGDGIMDITDNCPLTPNSDQEDVDSDGIGTACDNMETPDETTPGGNSTAEGNSTDDDSDSGGLPSIGVIGTLAAIGLSFVAVIRREQEE